VAYSHSMTSVPQCYSMVVPPRSFARSRAYCLAVSCLVHMGCGAAPQPADKPPLGHLPNVSTTAIPEWIPPRPNAGRSVEMDPREGHLAELRQLTFSGRHGRPAWSPDGRFILYEVQLRGSSCHEVHVMSLVDGETMRLGASTRDARAGTFAQPDGDRVLFAGRPGSGGCDQAGASDVPKDLELFSTALDGSAPHTVFAAPGYDANPNVAFDGSRLVFTSTRDGDLELYTAKLDGSELRRITHRTGVDSDARFSPDSQQITWTASRPNGAALSEYRVALADGHSVAAPTGVWVASATGANVRQVIREDAQHQSPAFLSDSRHIVFSSNVDAPSAPGDTGRDLYLVDSQGASSPSGMPALTRLTFHDGVDAFPAFSRDGRRLLFVSSRHAQRPGDTNVFVARWVESPE